MEKIQVAIRFRPLIKKQRDIWCINTQLSQIYIDPEVKLDDKKINLGQLQYDHCFNIQMSNQTIYEQAVQPVIKSGLEGINSTVFMYGQTGSGKTFTMVGNQEQQVGPGNYYGLLQLGIKDIFQKMEEDMEKTYLLRCSYIEIYNDFCYDLLQNQNNLGEQLAIGENNQNKEFYIKNVLECQVSSINEIMDKIQQGESNRHYAQTYLGHASSRSHTVFRLIIQSISNQFIKKHRMDTQKNINNQDLINRMNSLPLQQKQNLQTTIRHSLVNFVDLAGSEKLSQYQKMADNNIDDDQDYQSQSDRITEGKHINKSLFFLSQVIALKSQGKTENHIPYRNSPLTKILRSSLGGNSRTLVILCVKPDIEQYDQVILFYLKIIINLFFQKTTLILQIDSTVFLIKNKQIFYIFYINCLQYLLLFIKEHYTYLKLYEICNKFQNLQNQNILFHINKYHKKIIQTVSTLRFGLSTRLIQNKYEINYKKSNENGEFQNRIKMEEYELKLKQAQKFQNKYLESEDKIQLLKGENRRLMRILENKLQDGKNTKQNMVFTTQEKKSLIKNISEQKDVYQEKSGVLFSCNHQKYKDISITMHQDWMDKVFDFEGKLCLQGFKKCKNLNKMMEDKIIKLEENFSLVHQEYMDLYTKTLDQNNSFKFQEKLLKNLQQQNFNFKEENLKLKQRLSVFENEDQMQYLSMQQLEQLSQTCLDTFARIKNEKLKRTQQKNPKPKQQPEPENIKYAFPQEQNQDPKQKLKQLVKQEEKLVEMFYEGLEEIDCKIPNEIMKLDDFESQYLKQIIERSNQEINAILDTQLIKQDHQFQNDEFLSDPFWEIKKRVKQKYNQQIVSEDKIQEENNFAGKKVIQENNQNWNQIQNLLSNQDEKNSQVQHRKSSIKNITSPIKAKKIQTKDNSKQKDCNDNQLVPQLIQNEQNPLNKLKIYEYFKILDNQTIKLIESLQ